MTENLEIDMKENIPPNYRLRGSLIKDKVTWDESCSNTANIYSDMGVEPISENSCDSLTMLEVTPIIRQDSNAIKPNAPQVLRDLPLTSLSCTNGKHRSSMPLKPLNILRNDDNFLCRRGQDVSGGEDHFNKLSDEIILCVLRWIPKFFLARCATVCKRWSRLILDESIWRRIDLANRSLKPGMLGSVLSRGVCILRLSKAEISAPIFTNTHSFYMSNRLAKVQYLDLSMAAISETGLQQLLSVCHDLKKLSLENCGLNDAICNYIGENGNLEALNLCMCRGITIDGTIAIMSNCRRIRSLNLAWTGLGKHTIMYLTTCLPRCLSKLNLSGFREDLNDEDIEKLMEICPNLKELDVSDSTAITGNSIALISRRLTNLEYLAVSRCYRIAVSHLPDLLAIASLVALDVFGMLMEDGLVGLRESMSRVAINKFPLSSIARPTTGIRRTSIWGLRVRDSLT